MSTAASVRDFYNTHFGLTRSVIFGALILLAWSQRFVLDDAFISFRYADNFAHGKGLVWNTGERVEGYTNFLWTLLMGVPSFLGFDPVRFSYGLSLTTFALSLATTYQLAVRLLNSRDQALLVVILLGTNYSFSCYATGGLETQLQACLFVASVYALVCFITSRARRSGKLLMISCLLSLAILTRLDDLLLGAVIVPVAIRHIYKNQPDLKARLKQLLYLFLPMVGTVGGWLVWKEQYYGAILPNTYYAKVTSISSARVGLAYVYNFLESYWLIPLPILFLVFAKKLVWGASQGLAICAAVIFLWLLYVVRVGGDFMEFRFIVPILPFCFILIVWLIFANLHVAELRLALVSIVLLGSVHHVLSFSNNKVESIGILRAHVRAEDEDWEGIGMSLGKIFNHDPKLTIATTAAGAIPYYSHLRTIDMLGLNDKWVARNGLDAGDKPGHQKLAPFEYLVSSGVNLIIGHPQYVANSFPASLVLSELDRFKANLPNSDQLPVDVELLEIPITAQRKLFVLYLVKSPIVAAAIAEHNWRTYTLNKLDRGSANAPSEPPLYEAGARINFAASESNKYLLYGWSGPEAFFRWTEDHQAAIGFTLKERGAHLLRIRMNPFLTSGKLAAQRVNLELNWQPLATLTLRKGEPKDYSILLPGDILRDQNLLRFSLPDAQSPKALAVSDDARLLGISVQWMEIVPRHGR